MNIKKMEIRKVKNIKKRTGTLIKDKIYDVHFNIYFGVHCIFDEEGKETPLYSLYKKVPVLYNWFIIIE